VALGVALWLCCSGALAQSKPKKDSEGSSTPAAADKDAPKTDAQKKAADKKAKDDQAAKEADAAERAKQEARTKKDEAAVQSKDKTDTKVKDVKTKEDAEGVKTYTFGAVELEGRLKSPQILYFLRRVRAEFAAGDLGHRSFLGELADTRRHESLR
jgi:hypothetical protein